MAIRSATWTFLCGVREAGKAEIACVQASSLAGVVVVQVRWVSESAAKTSSSVVAGERWARTRVAVDLA